MIFSHKNIPKNLTMNCENEFKKLVCSLCITQPNWWLTTPIKSFRLVWNRYKTDTMPNSWKVGGINGPHVCQPCQVKVASIKTIKCSPWVRTLTEHTAALWPPSGHFSNQGNVVLQATFAVFEGHKGRVLCMVPVDLVPQSQYLPARMGWSHDKSRMKHIY